MSLRRRKTHVALAEIHRQHLHLDRYFGAGMGVVSTDVNPPWSRPDAIASPGHGDMLRVALLMKDIVILGTARTPIGSFKGQLSSLPVERLGARALSAAIEREGCGGDH